MGISCDIYGMEAAAVRTWLQQREGSPPGILSNLWAVQWQGILKSEPAQDPEELLSKFVRTARRRNLGLDVTSLLMFDANTQQIIQILEGPETVVVDLFQEISQDSRFASIRLHHSRQIETRECKDRMKMKMLGLTSIGNTMYMSALQDLWMGDDTWREHLRDKVDLLQFDEEEDEEVDRGLGAEDVFVERANAAREMRKKREESSSQRPRRVRRSVKVEGSVKIEGLQRRRGSLAVKIEDVQRRRGSLKLAPAGDRRDRLPSRMAGKRAGSLSRRSSVSGAVVMVKELSSDDSDN